MYISYSSSSSSLSCVLFNIQTYKYKHIQLIIQTYIKHQLNNPQMLTTITSFHSLTAAPCITLLVTSSSTDRDCLDSPLSLCRYLRICSFCVCWWLVGWLFADRMTTGQDCNIKLINSQ
eukprot:GHVQ01021573.1.p1 GENE.GHVQ01021573.1~~GHVQ01021573.1.p1  ORF type:complete len:119 (-),score=18.20 GHVQ01021573.1:341-697(-)